MWSLVPAFNTYRHLHSVVLLMKTTVKDPMVNWKFTAPYALNIQSFHSPMVRMRGETGSLCDDMWLKSRNQFYFPRSRGCQIEHPGTRMDDFLYCDLWGRVWACISSFLLPFQLHLPSFPRLVSKLSMENNNTRPQDFFMHNQGTDTWCSIQQNNEDHLEREIRPYGIPLRCTLSRTCGLSGTLQIFND